jgi:hypothetical protein
MPHTARLALRSIFGANQQPEWQSPGHAGASSGRDVNGPGTDLLTLAGLLWPVELDPSIFVCAAAPLQLAALRV